MFMQACATTFEPNPTDPQPDRAQAGLPPRIARLFGLVRKLIEYGLELAGAVRQQIAAPAQGRLALVFGTVNTGLILARILLGLRRASALQVRLQQHAAAGADLPPAFSGEPAQGSRHGTPSAGGRIRRPTDEFAFAGMPTTAQLAEEISRRPIGAVLADLCRDFGIVPGYVDDELWKEVSFAIVEFGGSLGGLVDDLFRRVSRAGKMLERVPAVPAEPPLLVGLRREAVFAATGPP